MLVWGAFAYLAALVPTGLGRDLGRRLSGLRVWTIVVAVVTTVVTLPLEAAAMGNGWPDAIDPATVEAVLFETSVGHAWQAQAIAALLLALTLSVSADVSLAATAMTSGLLLASLSLTGHAAMHDGWLGIAHRLNDACHLLAGGAWLGALVPLLLILGMLDDPRSRRDAGLALRRFSTIGHGVVALVILSGMINTELILGRLPTEWSSPYQAMLASKVVLVLCMTMLALFNRYILAPRLGRHPDQTSQNLRLATSAEIGLGFLVVGCVSVFGLLEPA